MVFFLIPSSDLENTNLITLIFRQSLCSLFNIIRHLRQSIIRLIHGHEKHGKAKQEDHQYGQELAQIYQKTADNNGPGSKEMMK